MSVAAKAVALSTAVAKGVLESLGITSGGVPVVTEVRSQVIVERVALQSVSASTNDYLAFDAEVRDDLGISAVGAGANTKACTFIASATWDCKAAVTCGPVGAGKFALVGIELYDSSDVLKQLVYSGGGVGDATNACYLAVSDTLRVVSGDYVKLNVYHGATGAVNFGSNTHTNRMVLTRLGT